MKSRSWNFSQAWHASRGWLNRLGYLRKRMMWRLTRGSLGSHAWTFQLQLVFRPSSYLIELQLYDYSYHVTVFPLCLKVGFPTSMWFTQLRLVILGFVHGALDNILSLIGVPCSSYVGINSGTSGRDFLNPMGLPWVPSVVSSNLVTGRSLCCSSKPFKNPCSD